MRKALDKTNMRQSCSSVNLRTNVSTKATVVDTMTKLESEEQEEELKAMRVRSKSFGSVVSEVLAKTKGASNEEENKSKNKLQKFIRQFKKKLSKDKEKQKGKENKEPNIEIPKESKNVAWTVIKIGTPISRSKSQ